MIQYPTCKLCGKDPVLPHISGGFDKSIAVHPRVTCTIGCPANNIFGNEEWIIIMRMKYE